MSDKSDKGRWQKLGHSRYARVPLTEDARAEEDEAEKVSQRSPALPFEIYEDPVPEPGKEEAGGSRGKAGDAGKSADKAPQGGGGAENVSNLSTLSTSFHPGDSSTPRTGVR